MRRRMLFFWTRTTVLPEDPGQLGLNSEQPVCYVLENRSLANRLVLERECLKAGLPSPTVPLRGAGLRRSVFALTRESGLLWRRRRRPTESGTLAQLVETAARDPGFEVQLVPVSVFWGQAPDRRQGWFKLLFADHWALAGPLRRFFMILAHGRNLWLRFSAPIALQGFLAQEPDRIRAVQKLARVLRVHFHQLRVATLGPDLSHRRTLVATVVRSPAVRRAVAAEAESGNAKAQAQAWHYADEIAADMSYPFAVLMRRLLRRLWDRLYEGIEIQHVDDLRQLAPGHELVYVPCHRSHIDYLLLSYVLLRHGLALPHVAAGVNLNLPLIGPLLRLGGAFYLRRRFKGNRLYAAVFNEYLAALLARGVPIEYFVEGGRSRTGRSLAAKPGLLDMTVRGYLRNPRCPLAFVPVYVGYEKLIEGQSYVAELAGAAKKKETLGGFFRSLKALRGRFGRVFLNFGEPILLEPLLAEQRPDWRTEAQDPLQRPDWLPPLVDELGRRIITRVNAAAMAGPVNLLALSLLSAPRHALGEANLAQRIELYAALLRAAPYSSRTTVTRMGGREAIVYGESLGIVRRRPHPLGDIILLEGREAVLMTYFRNNVLHLFSLPGLIACCFLNRTGLPLAKLTALAARVYPFIRAELFLPWPDAEIEDRIRETVEVMVGQGLLVPEDDGERLRRPRPASPARMQLRALAQTVVQTFERFYITVALLARAGPQKLRQEDLEAQSRLMAERLSLLYYGFDAPEFFDPALFRNFIRTLCERGLLWQDEAGLLVFDEAAARRYREARLLVSEPVRHGILALLHQSEAEPRPVPAAAAG